MRGIFAGGLVIAAAVSASVPASAERQLPCSPRAEIVQHLERDYREAPVALGMSNVGGVVEVLSSDSTGSWTIIITMPNGVACIVAAGDSWESVKTKKVEFPA